MFGWFKKSGRVESIQSPTIPTAKPEDFPFAFPIIEEDVDSVSARLAPKFELRPKRALSLPNSTVHSVDGSVWKVCGAETVGRMNA